MWSKKTVVAIVGVAIIAVKLLTFKVHPCSPEMEENLRR